MDTRESDIRNGCPLSDTMLLPVWTFHAATTLLYYQDTMYC